MEDILQISVEESLMQPGMFVLAIDNDYFPGSGEPWQHEKLFAIGKKVEIGFKSSTTEASEFATEKTGTVIQGEITAIEAEFAENARSIMRIRGYDVAHRLHRGRQSRSFQKVTDSDLAKKIAAEVGIATGTVDSSGSPHDYVFQENQTNMEFLRERATRLGFELFVQDGKLNFRKPKAGETLSLKWLADINSFRVQATSAEQVASVEVRGWDYSQKQPIESRKSSAQVITQTEYKEGKKTSYSFDGKPSSPTMIVVDRPVFSAAEADKMAQALCNELAGEFVQADAKGEGNPKIRPGRLVEVADMGKYSGKYYVTETHHFYSEGLYSTEFTVRGLRGSDLTTSLATDTRLEPGQTLLVGVVTNNKDPQGWGRVKVKFPTLTEKHESNWARVVALGAGSDRGFDCLPEVNDEVLVGFEHGDIHRPYLIGGVWNGKDKPPEKVDDAIANGKVRLRTFKTRAGHTLQFVDDDKDSSKKGVYLDTTYGHHLELNDSDKFVQVKTKSGHIVLLDEKNKKIEVKTEGGHQVLMDDGGSGKVDVISTGDLNLKSGKSGSSKKISLKAGQIELSATTKITLKVGGSKVELSNTGVTVQGTQATMKGTAQAKVQGATVNIQGSTITQVKGGIVKLN